MIVSFFVVGALISEDLCLSVVYFDLGLLCRGKK